MERCQIARRGESILSFTISQTVVLPRRQSQVDPALPLPPLTLRLSRYSKSAAKAIVDAGGDVTAVYHNPLALRQAAHPEKFIGREVKEAKPVRKTDIREYSHPKRPPSLELMQFRSVYYSNPAKHGYLAKDSPAVEAQTSST